MILLSCYTKTFGDDKLDHFRLAKWQNKRCLYKAKLEGLFGMTINKAFYSGNPLAVLQTDTSPHVYLDLICVEDHSSIFTCPIFTCFLINRHCQLHACLWTTKFQSE